MINQRSLTKTGFTLIEMAVAMSLIALTASVAVVYVSSSDTDLRRQVRALRYDLEMAKHEAVSRNATVGISYSYYTWGVDCNGDGAVTSEDYCYVIYEDMDDDGQYTAGEEIKMVEMDRSMEIYMDEGYGGAEFTPFGQTQRARMYITKSMPVDEECCSTQCMMVYYPFEMTRSGRIDIGEKTSGCEGNGEDVTCVSEGYCGSYYEDS